MVPQVIFQNRKPDRIATIDEYRQSGGYEALTMALQKYSPKEVQQIVVDANLQGRGGAGFPAGLKWKSVADHFPFPRYIISNIDEYEPGTFKDRVMTHADPHMIIEGMILSGYAVSAEKGIIFVRPSYENSAVILERELRIAKEAGYLGRNILGSHFSFDLIVHRSGGRYICGEGTAQINAIMGKRAHPVQSPIRSTEKGLWDKPTVLNNMETLVNVPHIVRHGAEWFKNLAKTKTSSGTKLYCVSGKVNRPGCFELPMGTRLSEIVDECAGGMLPGHEFKTCLPGGASTLYLPKKYYDVEMDFDSLKKVGNRLGTGAIIVFDQKTCLVAATLNLIEFFVTRILRLVHSLPGSATVYQRSALAHRGWRGKRRIHSHAPANEPTHVEILLRFCARGNHAGNELAGSFPGGSARAHQPEEMPLQGTIQE